MKEEDFIRAVLKHNSTTISNNCIESNGDYKCIADLTEYIDYGCKIKNSGCKNIDYKGRMCCCGACAEVIGHRVAISPREIPFLAKHFNAKTGYWREKKGCILPRKYRSAACLCHKCSKLGVLSTIVLEMLYRFRSNNTYPIISPHDQVWGDFVKALKEENNYIFSPFSARY